MDTSDRSPETHPNRVSQDVKRNRVLPGQISYQRWLAVDESRPLPLHFRTETRLYEFFHSSARTLSRPHGPGSLSETPVDHKRENFPTFLDTAAVGGMSTRPGAPISHVVPLR